MLQETCQHLRLVSIVSAAGAAIIIRWSAATLIGQDEPHRGICIGEHC